MNKKRLIKILSFLSVLFWAAVIFHFSAAPGAKSEALSGGVSNNILQFLLSFFGSVFKNTKMIVVDGYVRETAHSLEYAVFGALVYNAVIQSEKVKKFTLLISIALGFLYALSDETHQLFVPNRAFELIDLTMDLIGITIGVLFCRWLYKIIKQKINSSKK